MPKPTRTLFFTELVSWLSNVGGAAKVNFALGEKALEDVAAPPELDALLSPPAEERTGPDEDPRGQGAELCRSTTAAGKGVFGNTGASACSTAAGSTTAAPAPWPPPAGPPSPRG